MSDSFVSTSGTWDSGTDWSGSVPDGSSVVTIDTATTLVTVDGSADTASSMIATGMNVGGAGWTIAILGTLNIHVGAAIHVDDFTVIIGNHGLLSTDQIIYTGSSVDIYGREYFQGGGATFAGASSVIVEAGGTLSGDLLSITDSKEYIYGYETLSNGGGGSLNNASITIESGGILIADQLNGTNADTLVVDGFLHLTGGGPGAGMSNTIGSSGTVIVDGYLDDTATWNIEGGTFASGATYQNGTFVFSGTNGILGLYNNGRYNTGVYVSGFDKTDEIFLGPETAAGTVTAAIINGNTLDLIQGGSIVAEIDGFTLAADASTLTPLAKVTAGHYEVYLCFYEGTKLATADGEIAVQDVVPGTALKTAAGAVLPARWVGWSEVSTVFADGLRSLPIRIQAGALADGVPARDLLVSPDHAVFIDGVLVQAAALVNGTSICRETNVPERFRYYHIELATHELLLAENCPAESFVDNVDRMHFHNWDERETPFAPVPEMDLPRAKSARQLPAAIAKAIAARAVLAMGSHAA